MWSVRQYLRPSYIALGTFIALCLIATHRTPREYVQKHGQELGLLRLPCQKLGGEDVVVVMRTGVTQFEAALPIHLETTLRCPPDTLLFSDHEELYQGKWEVRDVLANVDPEIVQNNDEFALYRRVKEVGRLGLDDGEITGSRSTSKTNKEGKLEISGWVLDKWKFLPMINETWHARPDKAWYVFIETDTYLFWSTTLKYLSALDPTEPHVLGHRSEVKSPYPFMHGGSAFIISRNAMKRAVTFIQDNRAALDQMVAEEWAGDIALAYVFQQSGVPLTASWPIYKPHNPGVLDFGLTYEKKRFWCYPVGSFHHMKPEDVGDMWLYEQQWIKEENQLHNPYKFITHGDIFNDFILPRLRMPREDWDNQCNKLVEDVSDLEGCKNACLEEESCMQYRWNSTGQECKTLDTVRLGEAAELQSGVISDWVFDRIEQWRNDQPPCRGEFFLYDEYYS